MKAETQVIGDCAVSRLEKILNDVEQETATVVAQNDIPTTVIHFNAYRELVRSLTKRVEAMENHVKALSYEIIPTMFQNQDVKTITVDGVGRVSVNVRWNASMLDREAGMQWLRETGNQGLIIETVNAMTLASFAKDMTTNGMDLPEELFKVSTAHHISITKD